MNLANEMISEIYPQSEYDNIIESELNEVQASPFVARTDKSELQICNKKNETLNDPFEIEISFFKIFTYKQKGGNSEQAKKLIKDILSFRILIICVFLLILIFAISQVLKELFNLFINSS